jgi:hypothetical protein
MATYSLAGILYVSLVMPPSILEVNASIFALIFAQPSSNCGAHQHVNTAQHVLVELSPAIQMHRRIEKPLKWLASHIMGDPSIATATAYYPRVCAHTGTAQNARNHSHAHSACSAHRRAAHTPERPPYAHTTKTQPATSQDEPAQWQQQPSSPWGWKQTNFF